MPFTNRLFPASTFDLRTLLKVHAKGFDTRLRNGDQLVRRDQAFRLTAQLMLFQHSCHWFCRSRTVAAARLMARHKTAYDQVLAAVQAACGINFRDYKPGTVIRRVAGLYRMTASWASPTRMDCRSDAHWVIRFCAVTRAFTSIASCTLAAPPAR